MLEPDGETLALRASAGLYTHLDGEHSRVRVGELKIGAIAADCRPVLTNDVAHDPRIDDHAWARATAMVAFAGHPLVVDGRVVVLALFSRTALGPPVIDHLGSVADAIAQFVARRRAVEEERERLARELHDSVTQAIYGVALGARSTLTMLRRGEREAAAAALEEVAAMADTALTEMRELLVELHPGALLEQGLRAALERVAAAVASRYRGVAVECVPGVEPALTAPAREALYRIGQEALRNAVRHGRPGRVEVRLREQDGGVILEVSNDGGGSTPPPSARAASGWSRCASAPPAPGPAGDRRPARRGDDDPRVRSLRAQQLVGAVSPLKTEGGRGRRRHRARRWPPR